MNTITVVCPVYNEAEVIASFHGELLKALEGLSDRYVWRILYVVDPSGDSTYEILEKTALSDTRVQVLLLSARFGHQMSLLAGIDHAGDDTDAIVMLDSDLQHPPELIAEMVDRYEEGYDVVYTTRRDTLDIGLVKRVTSKLFYRFLNRLSDVHINENAADFRLLSKRVVKIFQTQIRERNQFVRGLVGWIGFKSIGIPYEVRQREAGRSKYSFPKMLGFGMLGVISFSKRPLQAAILVGFLMAGLGFLMIVVTIVQYFLNEPLPAGWATLAILISFYSGIQLVFLGLIGEYIGAIFDEVKARPHYLVDKQINFGEDNGAGD